MTGHLTPAQLIADDQTPDEREHLRGCAQCREAKRQLDEFLASRAEGPGADPTDDGSGLLLDGSVLGAYRIEGVLGRGGMAVVYRARHLRDGTLHAIKVLRVADPEVRQRLLVEAKVMVYLNDPHVVRITDVVDVGGSPRLVMELVSGPTLQAVLERMRLSLDQVDHLAAGIFAGVAAAHAAHYVHRDLKPGNILLALHRGEVVPKIADFGLTKVLGGAGPSQTATNIIAGTPRYMAPEQIRSTKSVDHRADIFSLGAILYELVTGRPAFEGDDPMAIFRAVTEGRYRPIRELAPDVPDRMVTAIEGALKTDPNERIADVAALAATWTAGVPPARADRWDLHALQALAPSPRTPTHVAKALETTAPSTLPLTVPLRPSRRAWLAAAVWVVALAAAIGAWYGTCRPEDTSICMPAAGPYMPLAKGNSWRYRVLDPITLQPQPIDKVLTVEDDPQDVGGLLAGIEGYRGFRQEAKGDSTRWIGRVNGITGWLHDVNLDPKGAVTTDLYYRPVYGRVDERCAHQEVGATWTEDYDAIFVNPVTGEKGKTEPHHVEWTVEAVDEEVDVPAGSFRCLRLRRIERAFNEDQTYWFAAGVGKIKELHVPKEIEVLLEYHLEPSAPPARAPRDPVP